MTDTDLFDVKSFLAVFSQIADFGIRTMTGKKRDNLRNSSRILSGGIETMSSSKNNGIEFASLEDCPVLVLDLIELPFCCIGDFSLPPGQAVLNFLPTVVDAELRGDGAI